MNNIGAEILQNCILYSVLKRTIALFQAAAPKKGDLDVIRFSMFHCPCIDCFLVLFYFIFHYIFSKLSIQFRGPV